MTTKVNEEGRGDEGDTIGPFQSAPQMTNIPCRRDGVMQRTGTAKMMHMNKTVAGRRTIHGWREHIQGRRRRTTSVPGGTTSNTHEEDCDDNAHKNEYEKDSDML